MDFNVLSSGIGSPPDEDGVGRNIVLRAKSAARNFAFLFSACTTHEILSFSFPNLVRHKVTCIIVTCIVAHKRPRSFCQKCRWQVTPKHAYTLDPTKSEWLDYAASPGVVWEPIGERSSHATCQGTFGHGCLISLSHCRLILA